MTVETAATSVNPWASIVFERAAEGIAVTDLQGKVCAVNAAFTRLTGYSEADIVGKGLGTLSSGRHSPEFYATMWRSLDELGCWQGEIWNKRKDGELYPEWLSINDVKDNDGRRTHYIGVFTDISRIVKSQTHLRLLAHHDPATGLPNRHLFKDRFESAERRALRNRRQMIVLLIDLNQKVAYTEGYGHLPGPELVNEIARHLGSSIKDTDTLARLSESEFAVLIEDVDGPRGASLTADKLLKPFNAPINVGTEQYAVTASIGIGVYPLDGHNLDDLLSNATKAMREARLQGRNTYRFYSSEMSSFAGERLMLEGLLRQAIANNELSLKYQPQFDSITHHIVGAEVLLRWSNQTLGMVGPDRFVPVAEDIGLIHPIGEWVLREACAQMVAWQKAGIAPQTLSVNISAHQIAVADFVDMISSVLADSGLDGSCLELEITEGVLNSVPYVEQTLLALKQLGVMISIDDFGTGLSSIGNLRHLPVRKLKIDRSFVLDIGRDSGSETVARAVIGLGSSFGLTVIAEGVETEVQADFLRKSGCQQFQGYLLGRAVTPEDFAAYFSPSKESA